MANTKKTQWLQNLNKVHKVGGANGLTPCIRLDQGHFEGYFYILKGQGEKEKKSTFRSL